MKGYFFTLYFSYNYDWRLEEAQKNVLRTHTTAVSAHQLYKLAKEVIAEEILSACISFI